MASGPRPAPASVVLVILAVLALATACTRTGAAFPGGGSADPSGGPGVGSGTSTPPGVTPSGVTPTPGASASVGPTEPAAQPPAATLAAEGGDPVAGQLGTYTWLSGGSDSPWLPGTPLMAGSGEPLTVTLGDGVAVADWSARRVAAGRADGSGAVGLGAGTGPPMTFPAPGRGTWSVQLAVRFDGGLGSATYYWQLTVR